MRKGLLFGLSVVGCILVLGAASQSQNRRVSAQVDILGFPFAIIREELFPLGPLRVINILLVPEYYSQNNLNRLFEYYSKARPDQREQMQINIYTDLSIFEGEDEPEFICFGGGSFPEGDEWVKEQVEKQRKWRPKAMFTRESHPPVGGGLKEWYEFAIDPQNPDERKTVVLKVSFR